MFGPFRSSLPSFGGLLWKSAYRMSRHQKYRLRRRMKVVDKNIDVLYLGLIKTGRITPGEAKDLNDTAKLNAEVTNMSLLNPVNAMHEPAVPATSIIPKAIMELKWKFPKEHEMDPKDKYTHYSKYAKNYRKSLHKFPKWTKLSLRENPKGF
ncbi:hypothetical protein BABINDRAFT_177856 [Babjeviella inositovora NRRL Y-12698]|uniref:54S ribosomal protein L31, mitochondrial n=1 Tax=Babjeviella inositovora NRRL Y-12698 TaxID=984486 RepID=A0A1E3QJM7_9ASCO|nr:uncharacterized protein BABINDRAFT_177856 [Babjeviella inositovora NRRL Y-12698]ODQ77895.1 hypothetical protein BABINDRAFT_177856 [Babjeviella inositovora NRRL Y-12698]